MSRLVSAGTLIFDQVDIFLPNQPSIRVEGLTSATITITAFVNNAALTWPLQNGTGVADSAVSAGGIYFNEISGSPGHYSLRFFPDRVGYWKINVRSAANLVEIPREYEVAPAGLFEPRAKGTLIASTSK